jgi:hypothetical protein
MYKIDDSSTIFAGFAQQKESSAGDSFSEISKHSSQKMVMKDEVCTDYDDRSLLTSHNFKPRPIETVKSLSARFSEVDF